MRIGIDVGGTKIEGIALGGDGAVLARRRVPTPAGSYEATLAAVKDLAFGLEAEVGAAGASVGIGMPGAISPKTGLVKNANSTWLNGRPFDRDLAAALGRPVRVANDADCFALSEATDGAAAGAPIVFGAILGTGVGGGIVIGGKLLAGADAIAGEWGHNPLPWPCDAERPGAACYCGKRGCIETYLSGPGFELDYAQLAGSRRSSQDIVRAAAAGDPRAVQALGRYQDRLARGLATVINVFDPGAIVLGGGMSNLPDLAGAVSGLLSRYVFSDTVLTQVVPNLHGDSSGVRGAAWLWPT
jgi:fructokinase